MSGKWYLKICNLRPLSSGSYPRSRQDSSIVDSCRLTRNNVRMMWISISGPEEKLCNYRIATVLICYPKYDLTE